MRYLLITSLLVLLAAGDLLAAPVFSRGPCSEGDYQEADYQEGDHQEGDYREGNRWQCDLGDFDFAKRDFSDWDGKGWCGVGWPDDRGRGKFPFLAGRPCGTGWWQQDWFESRFDGLVEKYDGLVAEDPDFLESEDYTDILGYVERLVDRHDSFLVRQETAIDWLGTSIDQTNDHILHYDGLIEEYSARDDLSETVLQGILDCLTWKQEWLSMRVDDLVTRQETLELEHADDLAFHDELMAYFDEISMAGGSSTTEMSLFQDPLILAETAAAPTAFETIASVPEPTSMVLLLGAALGLLGIGWRGRRRESTPARRVRPVPERVRSRDPRNARFGSHAADREGIGRRSPRRQGRTSRCPTWRKAAPRSATCCPAFPCPR